jgi:hypothetical protein
MGLVKGLKGLNAAMDRPAESDGPRGRWLKLKDGESVKIKFLQELDPDSPNYNEKAGLGFIAVEHTNPEDYRKKALCSIEDQGRCYGCEQHRKDYKAGWRGRPRFYCNVLVNDSTDEPPYVAIFSQGTGPKSATQEIIQYAGETATITSNTWRLKRIGERMETSYSIIPLPTDSGDVDIEDLELYDLEAVAVRDVPYEEQEAFYTGSSNEDSQTSSAVEW